jgi:alpha,alpha-trehalase
LNDATADQAAMTQRFPAEHSSKAAAPLEAVLFDMDGVITDTAGAHAESWKRLFDAFLEQRAKTRGEAFQPFDSDTDYRKYVDGKPRHDGIASFLGSRGISLPYGSESDATEAETICGLGNRKNLYFHQWLEGHPVSPFPAALALIGELRGTRIKVAVFSASRNARAVLASADITALFDAIVDGDEAARLRLPGKPDPAMLLEAAARLGVAPAQAAVIEDSIAGVEAGAAGAFGLVIGIDRGHNEAGLKRAGADLVVHSLAELSSRANGLTAKTLSSLPLFRDNEQKLRRLLAGKTLAVFLDYDGTLTPIVEDHTKALLDDDMRAAVAALAELCNVAVVSGRDLQMLRRLVQLDGVTYAGSHGFEIAGPGGMSDSLEKGVEFLAVLDTAEERLRARLAGIVGHAVERKRFSIAVHFRRAAPGDAGRIEAVVDAVLAECPGLRKGYGKKVFELRPDIEWDKGRAVDWLLERLSAGRSAVLPVYVGDDITDEDAFRALAGRGLTLVVQGPDDRLTAADYALANTDEVRRFLELLTAIADDPTTPHRRADGAASQSASEG